MHVLLFLTHDHHYNFKREIDFMVKYSRQYILEIDGNSFMLICIPVIPGIKIQSIEFMLWNIIETPFTIFSLEKI